MDTSAVKASAPLKPLDLDTLLLRLRAVAAGHAQVAAPVVARPWLGAAAVPAAALQSAPPPVAPAVPWALAARAGGLAPFLLADETSFVALLYRQLLARSPDAGGQAHLLERLRQHTPRTELLAELALSAEAQTLRGGQALPWGWLMQLALRAVRAPVPRGPWLVRGVWRRTERWLARRAQRSPLGLAWQVATTQEAQYAAMQTALLGQQAQQAQQAQQSEQLQAAQQDQHTAAQERLTHAEALIAALRTDLLEALAQLETQQQSQQQSLETLEAQQNAARDERAGALQGLLVERTNALTTTIDTQLAAAQTKSAAALQRQAATLHARLQAQERRLRALEALGSAVESETDSGSDSQSDNGSAAAVDDFLATLEVSFRGPVDALRAQLAQDYLGHVQAARTAVGVNAPCLDLGCGRGVWLNLLRAEGFVGRGVDLNAAAAQDAQALGLEVQVGDALVWLQAQPEASALVVSAFHLMEHLPFALRLALVTEAARVLMPGGLLILETPNPENIWVATHTFHHDPTHSQPLTPDSLEFLVNYCGLETVAVPRLHPYPPESNVAGDGPVVQRLNHMTCGGQDFAVIGRKI